MTATQYNVRAELGVVADAALLAEEAWTDPTMGTLSPYSPVLSRSPYGRAEVTFTLPAQDLTQATRTALAVLADVRTPDGTPMSVFSIEVLPTPEFDRRSRHVNIPPLLTLTEAAAVLGISRQGALKRVESGALPATRVGSNWVVPAAAMPTPFDEDGPSAPADTPPATDGPTA